MAAANRWAQTLRQQLKLEHGSGWTAQEQSEKVKLVLRRPGARKQSVTLAIPWNRTAGTAVMKAVEQIRKRMEEQNLTLAEAHKLVAGAPTNQRIGQTGWVEVASRYEEHRISSGTVKQSNYNANERPRINRCLELLNAPRSAPADGRNLMTAYTKAFLQDMPTGGDDRKRNLDDVARFLDFAHRKCGVGAEWLPLKGKDLTELVGERIEQREQTIPVKPDQLQWLLETLDAEAKRPELRLAIALVGLYGLRPAELGTLRIDEEGEPEELLIHGCMSVCTQRSPFV